MNSIVDFLANWKDLITKVFGEHTLAAALVTIVAIAAFVLLDREVRKGKRPTNLMIVLVGWAVVVPIVGFIMTVLEKIWAFIEAVAPIVTAALGSLYNIYERHPLLVAVLFVLGVLAYLLWRKLRPSLVPNRKLRILALGFLIVLAAHIAAPIADWLVPKDDKVEKSRPPESLPFPPPQPAVAPPVLEKETASQPASVPAAASSPAAAAPTSSSVASGAGK